MRDDGMVSTSALSALTGYTPRRLARAAARGEIPSVRELGGRLRFDTVAVIATLRGRAGSPPFCRVPLPDRIRSVYVAASSADHARARRVTIRLNHCGVAGVAPWIHDVLAAPTPTDARVGSHLEERERALCVSRNMAALVAADALLLLAPGSSDSIADTTIGAWWEAGAALVLRKPILISGEAGTIFDSVAHCLDADIEAFRMLRARGPGGAP